MVDQQITKVDMKQFKDLKITGPVVQILAFINDVSVNLPAHWRRDREAEARLEQANHVRKDSWFAFIYKPEDDEPSGNVFLALESGELYVPNVTPLEPGWLSIAQYNRILDKFADILRNHLPPDSLLEINVTSDVAAITDWVSPKAKELLDRFSNSANKSTGSSHPSDFQRWLEFLIEVHKEGSSFKLDSDFLAKWLEEELGWSSEQANKLAIEYEFARDVLQAYEQSR